MKYSLRALLFILLALTFFLWSTSRVRAATWTVNSLADTLDSSCSPTCTLRTAIALASDGDTINFSVSGTINIGTGGYGSGYYVNKRLTIDGSGQSIIINATGIIDSAFMFVNGAANSVLRNITVQGNAATGNPLINITASGVTIGPQVTVENNGNGSGIQFTSTGSGGSVISSTIRNNAGSGVLLYATNNITIENSTIMQNTYEGIKLDGADGNTIRGNYIGVNSALNPLPNNASGIAMTNGASGNVVENNTIAYNRYQNVLLSGSGTNNNTIRNNIIFSGACNTPPTNDNAGVVITSGASSNTVGPGNRIYCHRYDGIQVVGTGTNSNQIIDNIGGGVTECTLAGVSGSVIACNGRGISIINEYDNTPFPSISPSGGSNPNGPNGTIIQRNLIANSNSDGIYAVRSTAITIGGTSTTNANTIQNNLGNGVLLVGSSGNLSYNQVSYNGGSGVRVEPHYGTNRNYVNYTDDTVSQFDIRNNTFSNNTGAGIFGLDNEADADEDPATLSTNNTFSGNGWVRVAQQWFGAVEVLAQNGDPIKGITSGTITSATCSWESRSLQVYNNGAWGPSDNGLGYGPFTLNHVGTWFIFTGDYVANDGTYVNCEPRDISVTNGPYSGSATFSFDGNASTHPVSPDLHIPYSSPNATRNGRYQVAQVTISQPTVVVLTSFQAVSSGNQTAYGVGLVFTLLLAIAVGARRVIKRA